ncbi:hypothetical protein K2173_023471 [Erythroxylum novogranatense]|uniref:BZIP domain-containing protein n=1 Tax=Erythroxylum novogranatense TaxID=1862640 RepID=A0AAV8TVX8_9ROSI|nr:hypothetical protein K2173_023471 [Erythroxylum novogranatense]
MEEVWKDINLSSLHDHPYVEHVLSATPRPHDNPHHNPNFLLQDFLARPFDKDPPISSIQANAGIYGSSAPHPPTVLSLNSGPGFEFLDSSRPLRHGLHLQSHHPISNINSVNTPFEALDSPSGLPCFAKKRVQESDSGSGDRRHKRMVKNRESASRSRARKQESTSPNVPVPHPYISILHPDE